MSNVITSLAPAPTTYDEVAKLTESDMDVTINVVETPLF